MSEIQKNHIGEKALKLLADHRLDPNPNNYRFAYLYLAGESDYVTSQINYQIENDLRLNQSLVNEVMAKHAEMNPTKEEEVKAQEEAIRCFVDNVVKITKHTQREAKGVELDLSEEIKLISGGAEGDELQDSIARIIARARHAEKQLANASNQINRLQRDLEEARNTASTDELTGLSNRRTAVAEMNELLSRNAAFSVGIIDIDHFKRINDNWGHAVGDRAIKLVASHLQEVLSPWMVARWGGEEFLIIAETPKEELASRIDAARISLKSKHVKVRETNEPLGAITFSAGVEDVTDNFEESVHHADELLYQAKNAGRDRVMITKTEMAMAA